MDHRHGHRHCRHVGQALAEHVDDRADLFLVLFLVDNELRLHKNIHSVLLYLLVNLSVKIVSGRALLT